MAREAAAKAEARKKERALLNERKKALWAAEEAERLAIQAKKLEALTRVKDAVLRLEQDFAIKSTDMALDHRSACLPADDAP